jgi:hypothetical protein
MRSGVTMVIVGCFLGAIMSGTLAVQCLCGSVHLELLGQPTARANCHCQSCRDFYGTSMLSATAWTAESVTHSGRQAATFHHPTKQLARTFCTACGETVFGTNRLGMKVVPNSLVARAAEGILPEQFQPTMHLFYRHRVIDVNDTLIKYLDGWDGPIADRCGH